MKIAIPEAPYLAPLIEHAAKVCEDMNWELLIVPEDRTGPMLVNHMADLALVSPLGYGGGVGKVDLRIVPGPCMVLHDYTNIAGIRFREVHAAAMGVIAAKTAEWGFLPVST